MPQSTAQQSLDKIFGTKTVGGRDPKADLTMLKKELGAYKVEQLANLSDTEGSAIKEFADTLKKEMNTPEKCTELYAGITDIITNWAALTNGPTLTNVEKKKIIACTQAIVLTQLRGKGMNLVIDKVTGKLSVTGKPTTWKYPAGQTESQFLQSIGITDKNTAQEAIDGSQLFLHQAQILGAGTPQAAQQATQQALTGLHINTGTGANTPSQAAYDPGIGRYLPNAINDVRIDHPALFWGGALAAGGLALFGLFKGVKALTGSGNSDGSHNGGGNTPSGSPGNAPAAQRNALEEGWFQVKSKIAQGVIGAALLALVGTAVGVGGYYAYKKNAFGARNFIDKTTRQIKDGIKKELKKIPGLLGIPTVPTLPTLPNLPTTPNNPTPGPTLPNNPTPGPSNVPPDILTYRNKKTIEITSRVDTNKPENQIFTVVIADFKAKGPEEGLKKLRKMTIPSNATALASYQILAETFTEMIATEESISKIPTSNPPQIDIDGAVGNPPEEIKISSLEGFRAVLYPLNITSTESWSSTAIGTKGIKEKMEDIHKKFEDAFKINSSTDIYTSPLKDIWTPLYREVLVKICEERCLPLIQSTNTEANTVGKKFIENMDTFLKSGSLTGWESMVPTGSNDYDGMTTPGGASFPSTNTLEYTRFQETIQIIKKGKIFLKI